MDATSSELQQGRHVEIESSMAPNDGDPFLARSHTEGQMAQTLSGNSPFAQNILNVAKAYHETSPPGREYNVEVSHEFGKDNSTPFLPIGSKITRT